jgi:hypothetical protein
MSTAKQKEAARENLKKARAAQQSGKRRAKGGLSTAEQNDLPDSAFAFAEARKEPLVDAKHVRNAIARFDQVEDVTDAERDRAWNRIRKAAAKYDIEVEAKNWRELFKGGKERKR